ncbi:hypothetical protein AB1Y20_016263 [Prymnesium parvum]|uniref:Methyltransferase FkbM domain-containing protein n=1 Tax=Prymnesium parvum TaxID=97485 RepID=A0AB34ICC1_PRYPA
MHALEVGGGGLALSAALVPPSNASYNRNLLDVVALRRAVVAGSGRKRCFAASSAQRCQDYWVDSILAQMRGGFVVESGAFNGRTHSNSLMLEMARGWGCLLVEPNPKLHQEILRLHRKCYLLRGGLSLTGTASSFKFNPAGELGGIVDTLEQHELARISKEIRSHAAVITVPTYPLESVMQAIGRSTIDYWSLDVENAEAPILRATNFSRLEVGLITVEHGYSRARRQRNMEALLYWGFKRVLCDMLDDLFASPSYFQRRGFKFPEMKYEKDCKKHDTSRP